MNRTPEKKVKQQIDQELNKWKPNVSYRKPVQNGMGRPMLDYHGCAWGRYFAIEAKAFGNEPTEQQQTTAQEIREAGGKTFVVTGADEENKTVVGLEEIVGWFAHLRGW